MNFGLSEEQEMIVNTVRSFVEKEIYPHEDLVEQSAEVPREIAYVLVTMLCTLIHQVVVKLQKELFKMLMVCFLSIFI